MAIGRNAVLIGALAAGAVVTGLMSSWVVSPRGAVGPSLLAAEGMIVAWGAGVLSLVVATALAILVGRTSNTAVGMFVLGGAMFGLAWRLDTIEEIAWSGSLTVVALETIVWSFLVLGAALVVFTVAGPLEDVEPDDDGRRPHPLFSVAALKSGLAGALVLPAVWFIAQTPAKGQVIGAVFVGAMFAGLIGRLLSPHVQPILLFATPVLFGGLGHLIGIAILGRPLGEALVAGTVPPVCLPVGLDYVTGSLMGVAVGLGWARSFLHHEETMAAEASA